MTAINGSFDMTPERNNGASIPISFHFQKQLDDLGNFIQERFEAQQRALDAALSTAQEALEAAGIAHQAVHIEADRRYSERFEAQQTAINVAIHEHDDRYGERFRATTEELRAALIGHTEVHTRETARIADLFDAVGQAREAAKQRFDDRFSAHGSVHDLSSRAIDKAENSVNDRLKAMNEVRAQMRDQNSTFIPRTEVRALFDGHQVSNQAQIASLAEKIDGITTRLNLSQGRDDGAGKSKNQQQASVQQLAAVVGMILAVVAIIVTVIIAT